MPDPNTPTHPAAIPSVIRGEVILGRDVGSELFGSLRDWCRKFPSADIQRGLEHVAQTGKGVSITAPCGTIWRFRRHVPRRFARTSPTLPA